MRLSYLLPLSAFVAVAAGTTTRNADKDVSTPRVYEGNETKCNELVTAMQKDVNLLRCLPLKFYAEVMQIKDPSAVNAKMFSMDHLEAICSATPCDQQVINKAALQYAEACATNEAEFLFDLAVGNMYTPVVKTICSVDENKQFSFETVNSAAQIAVKDAVCSGLKPVAAFVAKTYTIFGPLVATVFERYCAVEEFIDVEAMKTNDGKDESTPKIYNFDAQKCQEAKLAMGQDLPPIVYKLYKLYEEGKPLTDPNPTLFSKEFLVGICSGTPLDRVVVSEAVHRWAQACSPNESMYQGFLAMKRVYTPAIQAICSLDKNKEFTILTANSAAQIALKDVLCKERKPLFVSSSTGYGPLAETVVNRYCATERVIDAEFQSPSENEANPEKSVNEANPKKSIKSENEANPEKSVNEANPKKSIKSENEANLLIPGFSILLISATYMFWM